MIKELKKMMMKAKLEKDKVKANLLATLIGEAVMVGKNDGNRETTDPEVLDLTKKFLKGVNENIRLRDELEKDKTAALHEKEILESLLPKQMTEAELEEAIEKIAQNLPERSMKMMGKVMGDLKDKYNGQFDGKMASNVVKKCLTK